MKTVEEICQVADKNGIGTAFRAIVEAASRYDMVRYTHDWCVRFAPQQDRRRYLLSIWATTNDDEKVWYAVYPAAFAEFYPIITLAEAESILGKLEHYEFDVFEPENYKERIRKLDKLFELIHRRTS